MCVHPVLVVGDLYIYISFLEDYASPVIASDYFLLIRKKV